MENEIINEPQAQEDTIENENSKPLPQIQHPDAPKTLQEGVDYINESPVNLSPTVVVDRNEDQDLSEDSAQAQWYYADGVPGKGEKPEWFNDKTFKNVLEQAKAQNEARKKLGGFTGAPEESYELADNELYTNLGLTEEDPLLNEFAEFAKEKNMSQETFNEIIDWYATNINNVLEILDQEEIQNYENTQSKIGNNEQEEIKILKQWGRNNVPEQYLDRFFSKIQDVDDLKMFMDIMHQTVPTQIKHVPHVEGFTRHDLLEMMADPKYQTNEAFRKQADAIAEQIYGPN